MTQNGIVENIQVIQNKARKEKKGTKRGWNKQKTNST